MINELQFHEWDPTNHDDSDDAPDDNQDQDKEM